MSALEIARLNALIPTDAEQYNQILSEDGESEVFTFISKSISHRMRETFQYEIPQCQEMSAIGIFCSGDVIWVDRLGCLFVLYAPEPHIFHECSISLTEFLQRVESRDLKLEDSVYL